MKLTTLTLVIVSYLQYASTSHQNSLRARLSLNNFEDRHHLKRRSAQNGFNWDSSFSGNSNGRISNGFDWNSGSDGGFVFEDDIDERNSFRFTERPTNQRRRTRPTTQRIPTSTIAVPGMGTPRTPCETRCLSTPEYNPICGDDGMTYFSSSRLTCAQNCGKRVKMRHMGACSLPPDVPRNG